MLIFDADVKNTTARHRCEMTSNQNNLCVTDLAIVARVDNHTDLLDPPPQTPEC